MKELINRKYDVFLGYFDICFVSLPCDTSKGNMTMRCPKSSRIIAATPIIELKNSKSLLVSCCVYLNEDNLWQINISSAVRHINPRIPTTLKDIKARIMVINPEYDETTEQLSAVFLTPYGHVVYPILDLNKIKQTDQELYVHIEADRNKIKVYCVKEYQNDSLFFSFPCVISETHLTARKIIEDIRSN